MVSKLARVRFLSALVWLTCSAYLCLLLLSDHALRASIIRVVEVPAEFMERAPEELAGTIYFENDLWLSPFRRSLMSGLPAGSRPDPDQVMQWISSQYPLDTNARTWVADSPGRLFRDLPHRSKRGSCFNDSIYLSTFAQSVGWKARVVNFEGADGMGGSSHTVTEVWMPAHRKWVLFDQQQVAHFEDSATGVPLSAAEVRRRVLTSSETDFWQSTRLVQGSGFLLTPKSIWKQYQRASEIIYQGFANHASRGHESRVHGALDWLEARLEPYGKLVLATRLLRSLLAGVQRERVVDELSPDLHYAGWYFGFRAVLTLWFASLIAWVLSTLMVRRSRSTRVASAAKSSS